MTEAVFIDLDGTLTDPMEGITRCIQHALAELGSEPPRAEDLTWCIGPPLIESFRVLLDGEHQAQSALQIYRQRFVERGMFENRVYPGIPELLVRLTESGCALYVATSKPRVYAEAILSHFDLRSYFDRVFGSELDGARVDKAELLAYALKETGVTPAGGIVVGDRKHDLLGARANHLKAIAVLYGYGSRAELIEAGAVSLAATPAAVGDLIRDAMSGAACATPNR